ncbi:unnamed protein product (macronuclear) [Paramecium tetraurelia]|uniref:AP180 N-terminal homology (ANTH) domain-containing protein n=1 Tax=Paramecium tetraurelia TaxID=5888 RepID=A0E3H2_PARTE|nr:uncharacterized protein GSPATT00023012001 [Paramecium tetraurelia]CAK89839.1 unnamed protein product [Paramecium tetraurelia]|eukprot:XP_001457236.1 hypothetical protein (macronuclear) [Paramecium tetraurelia strain d4-2]
MITNLVRNIVQFGGTSTFEKARLSATYKGDYYYPNESDIEAIMLTLSGKDPETRPQVGFTTILAKLESSQSKIYWNYIIKNLIILDRCIEYRFFVSDIADMNINYVENYVERDPKYKSLSMDSFIRKYYLYLKKKATLYSIKKSSFNTPKEEKKNYFKQQSAENIFEEFNKGQQLFDQIVDISIHDRNGLLKYRLNQYVYQLLLFTMLNLYYNSYILIVILIERLLKMPLNEVKQFKELYNHFLKNNEVLVNFINTRLYIKGYSDINTSEIARIDTRIIGAIEEYVRIAEKSQSSIGLSQDIQISKDLMDDELIILDQVEKMGVSIYKQDGHEDQTRGVGHKLSTIQNTVQKVISFESKLKDYQHKYIKKYPQSAFNTDGFKEDLYKGFMNNYSTEYVVIDPKLFKTLSHQNERESSQPHTSLEAEYHEDGIKIEFIQPIKDFDENDVFCFEVPKLIDNIEEFPNADEEDFPDYKDEEDN